MSALLLFDSKNKNMIILRNGQRKESFPIGELFLKLLEIDFDFYEKLYRNKNMPDLYEYFDPTLASEKSGQSKDERELNILIDAHNRYFFGEEHPYFKYADMFSVINRKSPSFSGRSESHYLNDKIQQSSGFDIELIFETFWVNMKLLQENMKLALEVCLDIDYRGSSFVNIPLVRFLEGQSSGLFTLPREYFHAEVEYFPVEYSPEILQVNEDIHTNNKKKIKAQELMRIEDLEATGIVTTNPLSVAFAEFSKMIDLKLWVRKCDNCGHYFMLGDNRNRKYCDKQRRGFSAPCNKIGAYQKERAKRNDPVHKARTAAENRLNGMKNRGYDFNIEKSRIEINKIEYAADSGKITRDEAINRLNTIGRVKRSSKSNKNERGTIS